MASQTSPNAALHQHHVVQASRQQANGHVQQLQQSAPPPIGPGPSQYLKQANEGIWLQLGTSPLLRARGGVRVLTRVQEPSLK